MFDDAIGEFAMEYADQNKSDYRGSVTAINEGRIEAAADRKTYFRASGCRMSISRPCAGLVGSRNSSIECASISRLSRSNSRIRCRRLSCNSDGRDVKNNRRSSPGPNRWLNSVAVT